MSAIPLKTVDILKNNIQVVSIVIFIIVFALVEPAFFSFSNAMTLVRQITVLSLVAIGGSLVIMTGNIDLAIGSFVGLTSLVLAMLLQSTGSAAIAIAGAIVTGGLVGLFNGFLVTKIRLNSIIITIAALIWGRGLVMAVTRGRPIRAQDPLIDYLANGNLLGIAFPLFIIIFFYFLFYIFLHHKKVGYHIFAIGCSEDVAFNSGINVHAIKICVFIISGVMAAIGGILSTGRTASALSVTGQGLELDTIIAVIIGGNRLLGGQGSVVKVFLGVLFVGLLSNGLSIMAVPGTVVQMLKGVVIVLAVLIDRLSHGEEEL